MHNNNSRFSSLIECSQYESEFIHKIIKQVDHENSEIFEEKMIFDGFKVKYPLHTKKWMEINPIIKKNFEKSISDENHLTKLDIKKVTQDSNLYRMGIDGLVFSSMVIYQLFENELVVIAFDNYYVERVAVEQKLQEVESVYPKILSTTKSLEYIIRNKCSLVRFGDGEFNLCLGEDIGFQNVTEKLQERLIDILKHGSDEKVLVTIPEFNSKHNNIQSCFGDLSFWEYYWLKRYKKLDGFLVNEFYGNTDISRNTVFFENSLELINQPWNDREVVFVIGDRGRFEIKKELFGNISSHKLILVPPVNAFEKYNEILENCLMESKDKLFLISAGPTATVLAFDLMKEGYQALDIGHLPNCYDQYLGTIKYPEFIPFVRPKSSPYQNT